MMNKLTTLRPNAKLSYFPGVGILVQLFHNTSNVMNVLITDGCIPMISHVVICIIISLLHFLAWQNVIFAASH